MPGPMYGMEFHAYDVVRHAHQKCQQKTFCKGPGCRIYTGKTAARRANKRKARQ